jgi:type VI secretion system protein ImpM
VSKRDLNGLRCSLFGKLAAKRDFIAILAPRDFLSAWEPWMQSCVSASRNTLGDAWLQAYLAAPIWRFWLGADICGFTVVGAFMSSVDGMGRYYPLTLFVYTNPGETIPPPDIDAHDKWFVAAENLLLRTLENQITFEAITNSLDQFTAPSPKSTDLPIVGVPGVSGSSSGVAATLLKNGSFSDLFTQLRVANYYNVYAGASFWWTAGGGDYEPFGFCCRHMPDPSLFASMLTGRLASTAS